jgi:hypothetical protein
MKHATFCFLKIATQALLVAVLAIGVLTIGGTVYQGAGGKAGIGGLAGFGGGVGAQGGGISPTDLTQSYAVDDFYSGTGQAGGPANVGQLQWLWTHVAGTGTSAAGTSVLQHPGIEKICTGSTSGNSENLVLTNVTIPDVFSVANFKNNTFQYTFKLDQTVTETFYAGIYYSSSVSTGLSSFHGWEAIRFDTTAADAQYTYAATDGSTLSTHASGVNVDTNFHTVQMQQTSQGSIVFTLDGANSFTITKTLTGVADTTWFPFWIITTQAAVSSCFEADRYAHLITGLSR